MDDWNSPPKLVFMTFPNTVCKISKMSKKYIDHRAERKKSKGIR